jgi:two-component system, response regulator / RNA-binding antiterminator
MSATSPSSNPPAVPGERIAATEPGLGDNVQRSAESEGRPRQPVQSLRPDRSEREILTEAAYERLLARLQSMPVIEQAKGILMAQSSCTPEEAFAMLRAASQRSNIKVRDLAEEIVARVSGAEQKGPRSPSLPDEPSTRADRAVTRAVG